MATITIETGAFLAPSPTAAPTFPVGCVNLPSTTEQAQPNRVITNIAFLFCNLLQVTIIFLSEDRVPLDFRKDY